MIIDRSESLLIRSTINSLTILACPGRTHNVADCALLFKGLLIGTLQVFLIVFFSNPANDCVDKIKHNIHATDRSGNRGQVIRHDLAKSCTNSFIKHHFFIIKLKNTYKNNDERYVKTLKMSNLRHFFRMGEGAQRPEHFKKRASA